MGKYPNSRIHAKWSDWHKSKCNSNAYLTDTDLTFKQDADIRQRLWLWSQRKGWPKVFPPIAVADIKWLDGIDKIQEIEIEQAIWYESVGVRWFTIWISEDFSYFKVIRHETGEQREFTEKEMIRWINRGLPYLNYIPKTRKIYQNLPLSQFMSG